MGEVKSELRGRLKGEMGCSSPSSGPVDTGA